VGVQERDDQAATLVRVAGPYGSTSQSPTRTSEVLMASTLGSRG
jgi:hypothetical protein